MRWESIAMLQAFANIQVHLFTACCRWITGHCFPIVSDIKCDASRPCASDLVVHFVYTFTQNKTHLQYKSTNLQTKVLRPSFIFQKNNILFEQPFTNVLCMSRAGHLDMNVHCTFSSYEWWDIVLISNRSLRLLGESSQLSWGFARSFCQKSHVLKLLSWYTYNLFFFSCQSLQTLV